MKIDARVVTSAEVYVTNILADQLDKIFLFHDFSHTRSVVKAVTMICTETSVDKQERRILQVAAWFHEPRLSF